MFDPATLLKLGAESFVTAPAYIRIKDKRPPKDFVKKKADKMSGSAAAGGGGLGGKLAGNLANKATNAAKSAVTQVAGSGALGSLGGWIGGKLGMSSLSSFTKGDGYDKVFKVQFNPSSLQISSLGGGDLVQKTDYSSKDGQGGKVAMELTKAHIEMSVQLIFDSLSDNYKAFASDLANFSSTNLINEGLNLANNVVGEKLLGNSGIGVQAAVEAFIAAVRNPGTRLVCFEWGDMYYKGELKSVNATYTMFDSVGRPVRAKVSMSIYLEDENISERDLGVWEVAYHDAFEGEKALDLSGGTLKTVAGSVFNF